MNKQIAAAILTDTHLKEENIDVNQNVFEEAGDFCIQNGLKQLHHFGDIFQSRKSQTLAVLIAFLQILDRLHEKGVQLVLFPGNHDKTDYGSTLSFLHPYKHHPALQLIDSIAQQQLTKDVQLHFVPFFNDEVYTELLKFIQPKEGFKNILFTHIGVTGAKMNNGCEVISISQKSFEVFDKVYIGHYHDEQVFDKFHYIGSSIQHNYGEEPDKGLTLLYTDLSVDKHPLSFPKYLKIEVDIEKLTPKDIQDIRDEKSNSTDNLRVVLVGSEEKIKSFNKQIFLEAGVSVQVKTNDIKKNEVDDRVEPFTTQTILEQYDSYCSKNQIQEPERGLSYLKKALNPNV